MWHAPHRSWVLMLFQRLTANACTSALAGAGPVYACTFCCGAVAVGFAAVCALPAPQAASTTLARARRPTVSQWRGVPTPASGDCWMLVAIEFMFAAPSIAHAVHSGLGEDFLQRVTTLEIGLDLRNLGAVGRVGRRAQAHRLEHLGDLTLRKLVARGDFLPERLGTVARAGQRGIPAHQRVRAGAPAVGPAVVRRHEARWEGRVVVEVLADDRPRRVRDVAG